MFLVDLVTGHTSCWLSLLTSMVKKLKVFLSSLGVKVLSMDSSPFQSYCCSELPKGLASTLIWLPSRVTTQSSPTGSALPSQGYPGNSGHLSCQRIPGRLWVAKCWPSKEQVGILWGFSSQNSKQKRRPKLLFCFWCFFHSYQLLLLSLSFSSSHNLPRGRDGYFPHFFLIVVLPT